MKTVEKALIELNKALLVVTLFTCFLDSLIVFMLAYIMILFFPISWIFALFPFLFFFLGHATNSVKNISYTRVEKLVPSLHEKLRTVADNLDKHNELVESLNYDVVKKMREIKTSYFINFKKIGKRIVVLGVMAFVIILVSSYNVKFVEIRERFVEDLKEIPLEDLKPRIGASSFSGKGFDDPNTFGEESIAELSNLELDLKLNPSRTEIDIKNVDENVEKKEFEENAFPVDIEGVADATFEESIPKEHEKIVKNYFSQISQST